MKIDRWTAELAPNKNIITQLLTSEGLDPSLIEIKPGMKISNKRTHLTEVIWICQGEVIFNLSGTQFVLRNGDRLEIAANTLYSYSNLKDENAEFYISLKI
jgi:quercetin dioxygenase-like cupin family protein